MRNCPICGSTLQVVREDHLIPVGKRRVLVELDFERCGGCGEEFVDPQAYEAAQMQAAGQVREELGLLRPEEIRGMREIHGLTQEAFEQRLDLPPKTIGRWERGSVSQSKAADKLLRTFREAPELFADECAQTWVSIQVELAPPLTASPAMWEGSWRNVSFPLSKGRKDGSGASELEHAA